MGGQPSAEGAPDEQEGVSLKMGGQPSAKGSPDEQEGGVSKEHQHETTSVSTAAAEVGGDTDKSDAAAAPSGESRLSLESASTAPSSGCSVQGDDTPRGGLLTAPGLGEEDRNDAANPDSSTGEDPSKREGGGSDVRIEGADEAAAPGTAEDAAPKKAGGTVVEVAKSAFRIALHSGIFSFSDMLTVSECSKEACSLCRDGRTFHIKVTAKTPLHVWSPPSPPPPLVGGGGAGTSRPWAENGNDEDEDEGAPSPPPLPPRVSRAAAAAGGMRGSSKAFSLGGGRGGRPLVRTGARIDESANRLSGGVKSAVKSAEKSVAPLRVSHITWNRPEQDLGGEFARELPLDLETLTFAFAFNGSVDGVEVDWPPGMKALHFGMAFNPRPEQPPPPVGKPGLRGASGGSSRRVLSPKGGVGGGSSREVLSPKGGGAGGRGRAGSVALGGGGGERWSRFLPPGLEEVSFGTHFNQPVEGVKWPSKLKRLLFGANFKQNVEVADWPDSLEELTFGIYFNQPVELVKWPKALKRLVFGTGFNQPVEKCSFPDGLKEITFGTHFNQAIAAVKWPPGLLRVTFGDRFNKPVVSATWPTSLTHLTFGRGFDQPLQGPHQQAGDQPLQGQHEQAGGGGGISPPSWPPAGLESVIVGSKFTGEAVSVGEGGVSEEGGKNRRGGVGKSLSVFRRLSPKRSKRLSSRRLGDPRPGSIKGVRGQGAGDGGDKSSTMVASKPTMVATSEGATTPKEKRASGRFGSLKG